jgi:excisionase family DNA binding protein
MIETKTKLILLTTEEVCEYLKISKRTLQSYRNQHIITFIQCGRKILYTETDILVFLEAHHIKPTVLKGVQSC